MKILSNTCYIIWICVALHLVADYFLQGCLADIKQKDWWKEPLDKLYEKYYGYGKSLEWCFRLKAKYEHDYIAGLICHATMWTLITFFPLMFIANPIVFSILAVANIAIHTVVDHMKANTHRINLCQDQLIHLVEVVATVLIAQI